MTAGAMACTEISLQAARVHPPAACHRKGPPAALGAAWHLSGEAAPTPGVTSGGTKPTFVLIWFDFFSKACVSEAHCLRLLSLPDKQ